MVNSPHYLKYPCFIIENEDGCTIRCLSVDGQTCVALFTDEKLVEQYLSQGAMSGSLRPFENQEDLRTYLQGVLPHYQRFVPIDANVVGKGYVGISITDFLGQFGD